MKKASLILSAVLMTAMMAVSCGGDASDEAETSNEAEIFSEAEISSEILSPNEVTIGTQVWMTKNLDVSTFRNGDLIPQAKTKEEWEKAGLYKLPAWCYYDNDATNGTKYGKLYNWYAVADRRGLAPAGWHIPSYAEWTALTDYLGDVDVAGTKMKSISGWNYTVYGSNESGFSGLPGGGRNRSGVFGDVGKAGYWWSATDNNSGSAWSRSLGYDNVSLGRFSISKEFGFSVRCLRD